MHCAEPENILAAPFSNSRNCCAAGFRGLGLSGLRFCMVIQRSP
jgi:hypothetical protein